MNAEPISYQPLSDTRVYCVLCDPSSSSCCHLLYVSALCVLWCIMSKATLVARCVAKRLSRLTSFTDANHIMPVCTSEIIAMRASASKAHNTNRHYLLNAGSFTSTKASPIIHISYKRTQKHIHYIYCISTLRQTVINIDMGHHFKHSPETGKS